MHASRPKRWGGLYYGGKTRTFTILTPRMYVVHVRRIDYIEVCALNTTIAVVPVEPVHRNDKEEQINTLLVGCTVALAR